MQIVVGVRKAVVGMEQILTETYILHYSVILVFVTEEDQRLIGYVGKDYIQEVLECDSE